MKKLLLICSIFLLGNSLLKSQTLNAGDIAFIGYHEDATDQFTWIALTDIPAGEEIYFTEKGWNGTGNSWFITSEGHMRYTAPTGGISCGTIVHINETAANTFAVTGGGTAVIALNSWSQSGGDQVLAYRGGSGVEPGAPTFIAGVHADYNSGDYNTATTWNNGNFTNVTSASMVPSGLTNGVNCVSLHPAPGPEFDNTHYDGTLTGTSAVLRALINNPANWGANQSNAAINITVSAFPVPSVICAAACTDPDVPTITATPSTICPGSSSTLTWTGNLNDATAWHVYTTSCGVTQLTTTAVNSLVVSPGATTTYYIRGEDGAGCVDESTSLCGSVTVTVQDITNPTITCPANQIGIVNGACNFTVPDYTGLAVVADNCTASPTVTQSPIAGTNVGTGTTVITLTATDGSSNTANCNFNVVVSDITNPTITCPGNQVGSVDGSCNYTLPDYTPLATTADNCPGVTVTQVPAAGTIVGVGTTNIVLTATDGATNTANCNFDVVVSDNTNPTITCPGNQVGSVNGSCNFVLPDYTGLATASDNCTASPTVTQVPAPGTNVGVGTTNIVLTSTDGSSNTANCNFNVVVSDNTNPTITCPGNQTENPNASCQFTLPDYTGLVTASDNCNPSPTVTQSPVAGTVISSNTTITMTGNDGNGNTAQCTFDVVLNDATAPTAVCQNINAVLDGAGNATIIASALDGGSTDNCGAVTFSASQTAFTCADLGPNNVTLTVTDGNSNSANCVAVVTVIDNTNPTITCPGNQTENPNASCQFTLPDYTGLATASDNCAASPTVTQSPVSGTVISGTTTITLTANDGNGNTAQCTFDVILNDATAPSAVCQNINVYLDGAGNVSIVAADIDGGSTDNCAGLTFSASQTAFTCADLGPNNVTLTVTDGNANSSNCVAVVTVLDTVSPSLTCPVTQVGVPLSACQFILLDYTTMATSADNCNASPTITQSPIAGTSIGIGSTSITLTADDGNGNTTICSFNVIVNSTITGNNPVTICDGDSIVVGSNTYTAMGTYVDVLIAANGCDSTLTTFLNVMPALLGTVSQTICDGDSIVVNGTTYNAVNPTGTEVFTNIGPFNCDSTVTVNLIVNSIDNTVTDASPLLTANQTGATYRWLDCDNGNAIIPSETNQSFTATANGNYAVEITIGSCVDTSACINVIISGIDDNSFTNQLTVFPNPTNGVIIVQLNQLNSNATVTVYNLIGKQLINQKLIKSTNVDLSSYDNGIYFIKIKNGDMVVTRRVVKQ